MPIQISERNLWQLSRVFWAKVKTWTGLYAAAARSLLVWTPSGVKLEGSSRQNLLSSRTQRWLFYHHVLHCVNCKKPPCTRSLRDRCHCLLRSCARSLFTVFQLPTGAGAAVRKLQSFSDRPIRSATEALRLWAGKVSASPLWNSRFSSLLRI